VLQTENNKRRILSSVSLKEKIGYGIGDMGFNFYWANIASFLLIFYTDTFGISPAAAGTMIFLTKLIDAFADPAMAAIADRTKTRFGKFRPYLLWTSLPMVVTGVLTYTTPNLPEGGKLIWAYATFALMMLIYTVLNIPYSALSGVISANSQERTTLISFRFIAAFTGTIIVNYFTLDMVSYFGNGNSNLGWQITMAIYGILAAILFGVVFFSTRERIKPPPQQRTKVTGDLKDLFNNRPWTILFILALIIMITITIRAGASIYYIKYYLNRPDLIKYFLTSYGIALAIGAAITPLLTRYLDKRLLMILSMSVTGILSISFFFLPKDSIWLIFSINFLIGLALGPKSPLAFSMYADTADYTEWKTGRRATAMTFAAANFSQKLGWALASVIIGLVLSSLGYVANTAQSDASQMGILLVISIIPGVIALIAAFIMRYYTLDNAMLEKIQIELKARKTLEV
jgi:GPH family glycoside/pentoside/hexuronide:cation symporter